MEPERMLDPAQLPRQYPTRRPGAQVPPVDPDETYAEYLARTGEQDNPQTSQRFVAGQRMAARQYESRTALTTSSGAEPGMLTAPPGTGPASPTMTVGPQPNNGRRRNNEPPPPRRGRFRRRRRQ